LLQESKKFYICTEHLRNKAIFLIQRKLKTLINKGILALLSLVGVVLFQDGRSTVGLVENENFPPFFIFK